MAVLCRDMHALGGGGAGGLWALHVQYVVSIANSAVGAAVYGLADCLAVGLAWLGLVGLRFITLWLAFYLSGRRRRPRKC